MTLENIMKQCSDQSTVLGQTLAYAWKKYVEAKTPEDRSAILDQMVWCIEEMTSHGHLVH